MVDIHHHLLPGLDDGSTSMETSLDMARMAAQDGITHIVATPHANGRYTFDPARNNQLLQSMRDTLAGEGVAITLGAGCDFHLSYDNIQAALKHPAKFTINNHEYLLVELPDFSIPAQLDESFYELRLAGITPILTHPERNPTLQRDTKRLAEWVRQGMLIQVTTSSVLGQMGKTAERMSHRLLADRWVHFLATDAHNTTRRPPRMREAREFVANKYGEAYAQKICVDNPLAAFEGSPFPAQEDPRNLFETSKPSFFKRLFGR
jgi:protein-tyrosine phosphatase